MRTLLQLLATGLSLVCLLLSTHFVLGQNFEKEDLSQLHYRHIGPVGNRVSSVTGIAGNPLVYYVGAATGGIWKTVDGGLNWKPIFDDKPVHAIGALAAAPSDPEIIYAGTGESFIRSNVSIGNGMWKSMDGGASWEHIGLEESGRIGRIVVHPSNPDIVYVAALGHAYTPQQERGIYMSIDGGKTWEHSLFVDENTGASDIAMDPSNPRILFAGMWQLELKTWNRTSGGPGSGVHMSTDAGKTWKRLSKGLPTKPMGKIALAMTPANPNRVYAQIETGDGVPYKGEETDTGELWRSDDKGKSWRMVNANRDIGGRQAYYTRCAASPDNPNEIYFLWASFSTSIDGGRTLQPLNLAGQPNWDHHEMWIDPLDGNRMIVVGDGGVSISHNRGNSWLRVQIPVAQLYHVTTDNNIPYNVLTNRQDGPSMKGPSRTKGGGGFGPSFIPTGLWYDIGGGESGFATPDPTNPDIIWSSASGRGPLGGIVTRFNEKSRQYRQVEVWPEFTAGHPAEDMKYRFQWTFPLLISPHDNNTVYVTSQFVHRTTNGGQSWEVISPDLSMNDKSKQGFSGGLTGDNIAVEYMNVIYAFDESPVEQGVFWAGTNDGLVHVSKDGGKNWTNVTANIPNLPELGVVRNIDASKWDAGKAYLTIEFHQVGNFEPYVYKTSDYGQTWKKITTGIDEGNLSYTRNIREDPSREGLLYLGTENKLYVSFDDGENWQSLMANLPHTPMYWIDIPEHMNDLVIGTYGRGIWILDDLSPIQQMTKEVEASVAHLFAPRPAYRFHPTSINMQFFPSASAGEDAKPGASLNFWLKEADKKVKLHITDAKGDTIQTLTPKTQKGINRVWWNFNEKSTDAIVFRTSAQYADWIPLDKKRTRKSFFPPFAIKAPPGTYTVHLELDGESQTQKLQVLKDPDSEGSEADIKAQIALLRKLHFDMNQVVKMINEIELSRRQLLDLHATLSVGGKHKEVLSRISKTDSLLVEMESQMIQLKTTGTGQDMVRYPARLTERIDYLASAVASADFPPTDQHLEVYDLLHKRLLDQQSSYEEFMKGPFAEFLKMLKEKNVGAVNLNPGE